MADSIYSSALSAYSKASGLQAKLNPEEMAAAGDSKEAKLRPSFSELMGEGLSSSIGQLYKSEEVSLRGIAKDVDMHELVTTVANAELTLQTVVTIRDKVINAYNDIIKMPI